MYICSLYTLSMGKTLFNLTKNLIILLQLDLKHIHKVNFYPSDNDFTQMLLVMLVTNMTSGHILNPQSGGQVKDYSHVSLYSLISLFSLYSPHSAQSSQSIQISRFFYFTSETYLTM